MPGPPPGPDEMDPLSLFTHGEFNDYDSEDPELLLYTQGEFPRAAVVAPVEPGTKRGTGNAGQGGGGKTWKREHERWTKIFQREQAERLAKIRRRNEEVIATALLMLDEDEDDDWF